MDFNEEKTLGLDIEADYPALKQACGYDHCYIIRDAGLRHAAWGHRTADRHPHGSAHHTARHAPVHRQLSGARHRLQGTAPHYQKRDAVCLETEEFPDAPNHPRISRTRRCCRTPPTVPRPSTRFDIAPQ